MTGPHDPMDAHVDKDAFWAAYTALQCAGVQFAEVRADTSNRVAVAVLAKRTAHGLGHMLELAQSMDARRSLVAELKFDTPKLFTQVTRGALDAAVEAAARKLADHDQPDEETRG